MEHEATLKKCPFCPHGVPRVMQTTGAAVIRCTACGAQGPHVWLNGDTERAGQNEAIRLWNQRGGFGSVRIALVNPHIPLETFKFIERAREATDRVERGDFGTPDRGVLMMMQGKHLTTALLRMPEAELRDIAGALISALDAKRDLIR